MKSKSFSGWCLAVLFSILMGSAAIGQKQIPYTNSYDSIVLGLACADTGAYSLASTLYECVSPNDTNYTLALLEDALAKESLEQDSEAIAICQKGADQESDYTPDFYNVEANVLMNAGNYSDAIDLMQNKVLPKYSNLHKLYYTIGMAQYKMHKYADAITSFQKAIDLNLYDGLSHYYLGKCCLEQGRLIPALLSFQFYLVLQSQSNRAYTTIGLIEEMTSNKYQYDKSFAVDPSEYHDSAFTELDLLIRSKIAMNKEYKATTKINYNFEKQLQLFLEQLKYVPNTGNYWMEKYVPFFTSLQQKNFLRPYLYFIMSSVNEQNLQKDIAKNKNRRKIKKFAKWADTYLDAQRAKKEIDIDGKKVMVTCNYYDNNTIESMGPKNTKGKYTGEWKFYYRHSGMIYTTGKYNDNGEQEGKWQSFYNTGTLKESTNYINGKREGTEELWYENSAPKAKYSFHNDKLDGDCYEYNISGILTTRATYKEDNLTGTATYYYNDGKQHFLANYVDGNFEGELKEFYASGQVKAIKTMHNDLKNGPYTSYWCSGKVYESGEYKNDNPSGHWKIYYEDGALEDEGDFNAKGIPDNKWLFYYRNGKKEESQFYINGKSEGTDTMFDEDGIEYKELFYKNDILQSYIFKDKGGNIISSGKSDGINIYLTSYNPDGIKNNEGLYKNDKFDGEWKIYNAFGDLTTRENYYEGMFDGVKINYYPDGKVLDSVNYTDDDLDGYYVSYHPNGIINIQGWYVEGYKQGDWDYYDLKGNLIQHDFYVNGALHGVSQFFETGKLCEEHYYRYGYLDKIYDYDSTGKKIVFKYISDKGNGKFQWPYSNGNSFLEWNYVNGLKDGPEKRYYYNGKLSKGGEYLQGNYEGTVKSYYENGNVKSVYGYNIGNFEGPGNSYYENGNLQQSYNYFENELDGERKYYYENGKLDFVSHYDQGDLEGKYMFYYGDSIPGGIFWYHKDNIIAYSSVDKDGNPVKRIPLDKSTGVVICYYPNGNKSLECNYVKGSLTGKRLHYTPNGKLCEDENFENGYLNGIQKYYYEGDTVLKEEDNYYYGEPDGICRYYYKNGKLEHVENYNLGTKEGPFRYYDKDGNLIKTDYYYDGYVVNETIAK